MTGLLQRNNENDVAETRREKLRPRPGKQSDRSGDPSASAALNGSGGHRNGDHTSCNVLRTLESEIIPRLVLSCRNSQSAAHAKGDASSELTATEIEINEFARLLITEDAYDVSRHLSSWRDKGASLEWLYLQLMGPAARRLGYLWEEDQCSIIDVTLGVGRLQQVLREISPEFQQYDGLPDMRRRALLLPVPGEQHTFGLSLLMDFFRREGWDLWGWPLLENDDLISLVRNEWFGVIGLSVSAEVNLAGLSTLIRDLRKASGNPSLGVIVGGPVFIQNPQLSREIGADATATDAPQAVRQAEALLSLK